MHPGHLKHSLLGSSKTGLYWIQHVPSGFIIIVIIFIIIIVINNNNNNNVHTHNELQAENMFVVTVNYLLITTLFGSWFWIRIASLYGMEPYDFVITGNTSLLPKITGKI